MTIQHYLKFFSVISIFTAYFLLLLSLVELCEGMPFAYLEHEAEEAELSRKYQKLRFENEHRSRSINPDDQQTYNNETRSDTDHFVEKHEVDEKSTTSETENETTETEETTNFNETEVDGNWTTSDNYTSHSTSKPTPKPKPKPNPLVIKLTKEEVILLRTSRLETMARNFAKKFNDINSKCTNSSDDKCFSKNWGKCPENATKILDCFKNLTWGDSCAPVKITNKNKEYSGLGSWNDTCFMSTWSHVDSDPRKVLECSSEDKKCRCFADESDITRMLDYPDYNTKTNTCKIPLHHRCILSKTECDNKWPVIKINCLANNDSSTYSHKDKNAYFCLNGHSTRPHIILIIFLGILSLYFHNIYRFPT